MEELNIQRRLHKELLIRKELLEFIEYKSTEYNSTVLRLQEIDKKIIGLRRVLRNSNGD